MKYIEEKESPHVVCTHPQVSKLVEKKLSEDVFEEESYFEVFLKDKSSKKFAYDPSDRAEVLAYVDEWLSIFYPITSEEDRGHNVFIIAVEEYMSEVKRWFVVKTVIENKIIFFEYEYSPWLRFFIIKGRDHGFSNDMQLFYTKKVELFIEAVRSLKEKQWETNKRCPIQL